METIMMGYIGFQLDTAPTQQQLDNKYNMVMYIALNSTPNIDCPWVEAVPKV